MKIESTVEKLNTLINRIQKVSSKNLSLPILENVLIIAQNNSLTLRTTNLHVGTEVVIPVKTEGNGEVAVKLDLFVNIINSLDKNHKIFLETDENTLMIKTPKSEMVINTYSTSDFPTLPQVTDGSEFIIPIDVFIDGLKSVMYAASLSEIKPEISSVYLHMIDNELVFVSTDSFRLAEKRVVIPGLEEFNPIIIPIKNVQELIKTFNGIEGEVLLKVGKNQISLQNNEIYFTSRIIDGNYPNYIQIIPKEEKTSTIILKDDLITSLRLLSVFSDAFHQILLKVDSKKNSIRLKSRNTEVGENDTEIDAVVEGEDIEMYFNNKYLSDALSALQEDSIQFSFTEKNKPFVVKSVGDNSFLYLIMPMNR